MTRFLMLLAALMLLATPVAAQDSHAGHGAQPDPHAGHQMTSQPAADAHAGHQMRPPTPADPHAGHAMGPPDTPTGTDNPGRPAQTPPPAEAFTGPAHAADTIFGAETMAPLREQVRREVGEMVTTSIIFDRIEAGIADDDTAWLWDASGWIGGDINRFYWKSEGEGDSDAGLESVEVQALYSRAIRPYWDLQVGVRQDFIDDGDDTTHLVAGIQGLAPGYWEVDAAAFLSTEGDLTARVEAEWDVRLTQRLILQPRAEVDLSASEDAARGLAGGFTGVEAGLRLRYEIRREFAPYVGVEWHSALGGTADLARASGHPVEETRFLIGLRAWY